MSDREKTWPDPHNVVNGVHPSSEFPRAHEKLVSLLFLAASGSPRAVAVDIEGDYLAGTILVRAWKSGDDKYHNSLNLVGMSFNSLGSSSTELGQIARLMNSAECFAAKRMGRTMPGFIDMGVPF